MADIFAITTVYEDTVKVNESGSAIITFTVTNKTGSPVRGVAKVKSLDNTQGDWLSVEGETERDFSSNGTQQYTVNFNKPISEETQEAQQFPFRLDVISSANPDEDFTEGPTVSVEIPEKKVEEKKPFPIWIPIVAGVLLLAIIGGVVGYLLLRDSTITVPDVVGKTSEEAKTELKKLNLKVEEIFRRDLKSEPGKIITQTPKPGKKIKVGEKVVLTFPLKKIHLPNLVSKHIIKAEKELKTLGLKTERAYEESSKKKDFVINQSPRKGSEVDPKSSVTLTLPNKVIRVPDLRNMTYEKAEKALKELGLKAKRQDRYAPNAKIGTVALQLPKRGQKIKVGAIVTLHIAVPTA